MQRMGNSGDFYYAYVSKKDFDIQEIKQKIGNYVACRKYQEAKEILLEFEKEAESKEKLNQQFILHIKSIINRNNDEDLDNILNLLYQAINLTIPNFDENKITTYLLTNDEIKIINNIAITYYGKKDSIHAINILLDLKKCLEDRYLDIRSKNEILPLILYNLSKWLGLEKRYEEGLIICNKGIEACNHYGKLRSYGEIFCNKAYILYELNKLEESIECFKRSYYILISQDKVSDAKLVSNYFFEKFGKNVYE